MFAVLIGRFVVAVVEGLINMVLAGVARGWVAVDAGLGVGVEVGPD